MQMLLWPLAYTFRYLGFDVLRPLIVHGVHGYHKGAAKDDLENRLRRDWHSIPRSCPAMTACRD
ncbi:NAD(P)H-dependent oxidoreductase [Marinobacter sp. BW6]|nr:NAD(P)H-dependent oxidoreductase [Marinobacter sp. BW6]